MIFAAAEGITAKFIASISRESSRGFSTSYYVKESSPIRSVADLKGRTVGINGFSTSGHLWLKAALDKHGLADTDVRITPGPVLGDAGNRSKPDASTSGNFRSPTPRSSKSR